MISLCRYLLQGGSVCTQAAIKGEYYCRHHLVVRRTVAKSLTPDPYGFEKTIPFVFPDDRAAVQMNYFLVLQALNDKKITAQTANTMNRLLRSCEMNLKAGALHEAHGEKKPEPRPERRNRNEKWLVDDDEPEPRQDTNGGMVRSVILTPEGEEIAPSREVWEEGEAESHGQDCPCRKCAEEFRGAEPERHHAKCQCERCSANSQQSIANSDQENSGQQSAASSQAPLSDLSSRSQSASGNEAESLASLNSVSSAPSVEDSANDLQARHEAWMKRYGHMYPEFSVVRSEAHSDQRSAVCDQENEPSNGSAAAAESAELVQTR